MKSKWTAKGIVVLLLKKFNNHDLGHKKLSYISTLLVFLGCSSFYTLDILVEVEPFLGKCHKNLQSFM